MLLVLMKHSLQLKVVVLFLTEEIICKNSDKYAEKNKSRSPYNYSRYPGMTTTPLLNLVGLFFFFFGLEKLAYYTDCWTTTGGHIYPLW